MRQPRHTSYMLRHDESLEEMRERLDREHAMFFKKLCRERRSLVVLLVGFSLHVSFLPHAASLSHILLFTSIFLIFVGQFIYVMGME